MKRIYPTNRLKIQKIVLTDAPFVLELLNSPEWIDFIGNRKLKTLKEAKLYIQNHLQKGFQNFGFGYYKVVLKETNISLGIVGFTKKEDLSYPDIGYAFLATHFGKGFATEAVEKMLEVGFKELKFRTICAITEERNIASIRLLKKCNFEQKKDKNLNDEVLSYFERTIENKTLT